MLRTLAALAALFIGQFFFTTGHGLMMPLVSLTLASHDPRLISIIVAGFYVGFVAGSLAAPRIIGRVGHIRAFAASCAAVIAIILMHPLIPAGWSWITLRIVHGLAAAVLFVVIESWLSDQAPNQGRGTVLSLYMIINYAAQIIGQRGLILADPADPGNYMLFSIAAMLFAVAVIPVSLIKVTTPSFATSPATPTSLTFFALYAISPLGIVGCIAVGAITGSFSVMGPVFAHLIKLDNHAVTWFMNAATIGGLVMQWPVGWLSDHYDRRRILLVVTGVTAILSGAIMVLSLTMRAPDAPWLFLIIGILGGCMYTIYPICAAHAQDHALAEQRVGVAGGLLLAFGLGAVLGPLLVGNLMHSLGPLGLFLQMTVVAASLLVFTLYRIARRNPPSQTVIATHTHVQLRNPDLLDGD